jgi:beta-glucanase (GH16 family)
MLLEIRSFAMNANTTRSGAALFVMLMGLAACTQDMPTAPDVSPPAFARPVPSSPLPFDDTFDSFDGTFWETGNHALGQSWLDPANVVASGGLLRLQTPAGTRDGAEIASRERVNGATLTARMRCGLPAGALCAFFLYEGVPGDRNDEIDIEILAATRRMMMTTWVRGRQTNHTEIQLPFDPSAGFHDYGIVWAGGNVAFTVDGSTVESFSRKVPSRAMRIYANAWWPVWLSGALPTGTTALEIDRITGS